MTNIQASKDDIKPKRSLGQNFLVSQKHLNKIVNAADLRYSDTVVEIGPGTGLLTKLLADRAKSVIAGGKDNDLAKFLEHKFKDTHNLKIINYDALTWDHSIVTKPYKVVANLPYYAANPIVRKFLESTNKPDLLVVTVQNEVAESMVATKGQMRTLSLAVQLYCMPEIVGYIKPDSFRPKPKVMSAIVKMLVYNEPLLQLKDRDGFFSLIKAGFVSARKQLPNSLSKIYDVPTPFIKTLVEEVGIDPKLRAQSLDLSDWGKLYLAFRRNKIC